MREFSTSQIVAAHVPLSIKAAVYEAAMKRGTTTSKLARQFIEDGLKTLDKSEPAASRR